MLNLFIDLITHKHKVILIDLVQAFNKTIHNEMLKIFTQNDEEFNIRDAIRNSLLNYNNKVHITTKTIPT